MPLPFVFLLLRSGHSRELRWGGLPYAFLFPAAQLIVAGASGWGG
jgi:hypothetical protein